MRLQILIPQYRENEEVISTMLTSIAIQQGVDWGDIGVLICNDGGDVILTDSFLKSYPYNVQYIRKEHVGLSHTRNALLKASTADYIMACDADDMFSDVLALYRILNATKEGFDVLIGAFLGERQADGRKSYLKLEKDTEFVHGKVFRRDYLLVNDIHWLEQLTGSGGDEYFLGLALNLTNRMLYCNTPYYMWRWNSDSVCRGDKDYFDKDFKKKLVCEDALIDGFIERRRIDKAQYYAIKMFYSAFFMIYKLGQKDEYVEQFRNLYIKHKGVYDIAPEPLKKAMYANSERNFASIGVIVMDTTFNNWIRRITT